MPLNHIINCSLLSGIVPSIFRISEVASIIRNSMRDDPCNYCSVSILLIFSQIVEMLIANKLFTFL